MMTDAPADAASEAAPGLRERKKQLTREAIVDAAERLFEERGYDEVTVAEIADAANVSVKTLFVYFRSKEDLAFADTSLFDGVTAAIRDRPTTTTPAQAVAGFLVAAYNDPQNSSTLEGFHRGYGSSAAVQNRLLRLWAELEDRLVDELAAEREPTGVEARARLRIYAGALVGIIRSATSNELLRAVDGAGAAQAAKIVAAWLGAAAEQAGGRPE
jgi:AcrR family transcriptional regulator